MSYLKGLRPQIFCYLITTSQGTKIFIQKCLVNREIKVDKRKLKIKFQPADILTYVH